MDYNALAREYMKILYKMRKRKSPKRINDSLHGEQFVLAFLSRHDGRVIPGDISKEMGISSARVAAALNNLEVKGMISRSIDPCDRRRILVELTDAGRMQEAEHTKQIMGMLARMLEGLGEEDSVVFLRILGKLSELAPDEFFNHGPAIK
jgi:DNA-binding MarR family transcriptional regulator